MAQTPEGRRLTEQHRRAQQQVRDGFLAEFIALWALLDPLRLDDTGPGWIQAVMRVIRAFRIESAQTATEYFWEFQLAEAPNPRPRPRIPGGVTELPPVSSRPGGPVSPPAAPRTGRPPRRGQDGLQGHRPPPEVIIPERSTGVRFDFDEDAFRRAGEGRAEVTIDIPELDTDRLDRATEVSLIVTGPVGQKSKRSRGKTTQQARDESFVESSGAATRQVLTGGRQSLLRLAEEDSQLIGWIRVTDGDPCFFCAMLASRGPVFKGQSFSRSDPRFEGPGTVKVHDHCACTVEPVYNTDTLWPGRAREFQKLWNDNIRNRYSGDEARREWRRLYEARRRGDQPAERRTRGNPANAVRAEREQMLQRQREILAQIASLERSSAALEQRRAHGDDVDRPLTWQRDQLQRLRAELEDVQQRIATAA